MTDANTATGPSGLEHCEIGTLNTIWAPKHNLVQAVPLSLP
jgi:hypothetical protein